MMSTAWAWYIGTCTIFSGNIIILEQLFVTSLDRFIDYIDVLCVYGYHQRVGRQIVGTNLI